MNGCKEIATAALTLAVRVPAKLETRPEPGPTRYVNLVQKQVLYNGFKPAWE